jgi:hypothetical protein
MGILDKLRQPQDEKAESYSSAFISLLLSSARSRTNYHQGTNSNFGRSGNMKKSSKAQADDWIPVLWAASATLGVLGIFAVSFHFLLQPTVYENPGLAAYSAPPETRLVPLPGKSDAPALSDLPELPQPASTALAQAQTQAKPVARSPFRRRSQVTHRGNEQPRWGYSPQGNYAYRDWNSNRAWGGGFKSWF